MDDLVKLRVLGLSYSQIRQGAYALILAEENGPRRIPVVIGSPEAQSIAIRLEKVTPPRPLTHDLFSAFTHAFGVRLTQVLIYKFADGVFYSEMTFTDGDRTITLDARTSDAIAIAIRTGAQIYTYESIVRETGFLMEEATEDPDDDNAGGAADDADIEEFFASSPKLENYAIEELERTLAELIEREEYEEAAKVTKILEEKRRKEKGNDNI